MSIAHAERKVARARRNIDRLTRAGKGAHRSRRWSYWLEVEHNWALKIERARWRALKPWTQEELDAAKVGAVELAKLFEDNVP